MYDLQQQLSQLQKISIDMDAMWRMQSMRESGSKKSDVWKRKVEQIGEEADVLRMSLDKFTVRQHRRHVEESQRQELLQRRSEGGISMDLGAEVAARRSIANSKSIVEEAYQTGVSMLSAMSGQRERLKSAQKKVLDVLNGLGLSDSVLRVAERRLALDKVIAYGGMLAFVLVFALLFWWFKS